MRPRGARIVVAERDPSTVSFLCSVLRHDGHAVFHAYDGHSASRLVEMLDHCELVLTDTCIRDALGLDLIVLLRERHPRLPIVYLASPGVAPAELDGQLPADVPILPVPCTAAALREVVSRSLGAAIPRPRESDA